MKGLGVEGVAALRARLELAPDLGGKVGARRVSGWEALDRATAGGFFVDALNEVGLEHPGCGAVEALLPALAAVREGADAERFHAWVHPTHLPYPPALAQSGLELSRWLIVRPESTDDHLWALDTILRSGLCDTLVTHLDRVPERYLRRLQLAAREGRCLALIFRPAAAMRQSSPAALRLMARPLPSLARSERRRRLGLEVLKCQGSPFAESVVLEWNGDALDEPAASRALDREAHTVVGADSGAAARAFGA